MINKLDIEGVISSIHPSLKYFMIKTEFCNFSGSVFWSHLKVSLYTEDNKKWFAREKAQKGHLVRCQGMLKVNINKYNQLIPTLIPTDIRVTAKKYQKPLDKSK